MHDGPCDVKGNMFQTQDAFEDICFENGNYAILIAHLVSSNSCLIITFLHVIGKHIAW